jgi:hypothetical protein
MFMTSGDAPDAAPGRAGICADKTETESRTSFWFISVF